jgi:hypothetical protein
MVPLAARTRAEARVPLGARGSIATVPAGPRLPTYDGPCLSSLVPALLARGSASPSWLPEVLAAADQVVLLVLDGLGWCQLEAHRALLPTLASGSGGPISSVVPSTTASALTSLATGTPPAQHGIVGYRLAFGEEVLNVLRWRTEHGDARRRFPASRVQPLQAFGGQPVPVVTRAEFASTGFSAAHLAGGQMVGWVTASGLVVEVRRLLRAGQRFVYAYYDGVDKVAHALGLGEHYRAELVTVDRLVADLRSVLPRGAALAVTADHGQVEVGSAVRSPSAALLAHVALLSGEGRFRWLHARPGAAGSLAEVAREEHGAEAWVVTRQQVLDEHWFGGPLAPEVAARLGDVALVAREPVAFLDPADTGETRLAARHGSLTEDEMLVPLLGLDGN